MKYTQKMFYYYVSIILFLVCSQNITVAKPASPGNGLLKKRVAERQAHQKADSLLEKVNYNSMQELANSLEGMNRLLATLQVSSVDQAIKAVEAMQKDIQELLAALDADSVSAGVKQAKKVRSVVEQLSHIQTK